MYSITITITDNHKNQRLQITFQLLKTCNQLHVIMITDYNYNRSAKHTYFVFWPNEIKDFCFICLDTTFILTHCRLNELARLHIGRF